MRSRFLKSVAVEYTICAVHENENSKRLYETGRIIRVKKKKTRDYHAMGTPCARVTLYSYRMAKP